MFQNNRAGQRLLGLCFGANHIPLWSQRPFHFRVYLIVLWRSFSCVNRNTILVFNVAPSQTPMCTHIFCNQLTNSPAYSLFQPKSNMVIVGGTTAQTGEAPWQVLIENMNNAEICGGAIINTLFVLTAAHCTELFRQNGQGKFAYPANILSKLH